MNPRKFEIALSCMSNTPTPLPNRVALCHLFDLPSWSAELSSRLSRALYVKNEDKPLCITPSSYTLDTRLAIIRREIERAGGTWPEEEMQAAVAAALLTGRNP